MESSSPSWEKLSNDLKDYGNKIDEAKTQFDNLSINIDDFTKQLEEAAARERKITVMLNDFMNKIEDVSQQNWDPSTSYLSEQAKSPLKLLSTPAASWGNSSPSSLLSTHNTSVHPQTSQSPTFAVPPSAPSAPPATILAASTPSPPISPLRSSDLEASHGQGETTQHISSSQLKGENGGPHKVHISRNGSISITQPPKKM
jgi:hypothetical protein